MSEEEYSPYCEFCGHCGEIGCCGISGFLMEHVGGNTNCKNEEVIIEEIISICNYETKVFKQNEKLEKQLQAYKDKETKLRKEIVDLIRTIDNIEEILDGSDE